MAYLGECKTSNGSYRSIAPTLNGIFQVRSDERDSFEFVVKKGFVNHVHRMLEPEEMNSRQKHASVEETDVTEG